MSQIKLKHSGGNGVILAAPDSNPASDRTLKLPSNADGTILSDQTTASGAMMKMISVAVDSNITVNASGGTVFIQGNNSRFHGSNGGPGTNFSGFSMGNTSGQITFPETGVYLLMFICDGVVTTTNVRGPVIQIYVTQDNSTYVVAAQTGLCINRPTGTTSIQNMSTQYIFDVTNTTTHKCKFGFGPDNVGTLFAQADSTMFLTGFHIIKLRDT